MSGVKYNPHNRRENGPNRLNRNARPYIPTMATAEQQEKVHGLRELYHGRFPEDGLADLLKHLQWDERESAKYLQQLPPSNQEIEQDDPELKNILTNLRQIQSNGLDDIWHLVQSGKIKTPSHLFACSDCKEEWWKRVPIRKQVSKCQKCRVKYESIPREHEWGWAIFTCPCGSEFGGWGQMGKTESICFKCGTSVTPSRIQPPSEKRGPPKSRSRHQCNAPNCHNRGNGDDVSGTWNCQCMHPKSRQGVPPMGSRKHISTGSTVDTFLPQNINPKETIFAPPLGPALGGITEEEEEDC